MKKLMLLLLCAVFAGMQVLNAQGVTITGKATDATGEAMPGVTIQVKGTTSGTVTQADGTYRLNVPADATTLVFSFVGMKTQEVVIAGQSVIDVALEEEVTALSEIVVVGYATQTKASVTGAVSTVSNDDLTKQTGANAIERMQGKATGVTVQTSHSPGGDASIFVRGMGTINNNDPLFVIDGVPTKTGFSQINPNEIESMTVLKDAASAAIYGARGANGVIIITTKRGTTGKAKVSFTGRMGVSKAVDRYDLLNTQEYGELLWLEFKNRNVAPTNAQYGSGTTPVIPDYIIPSGASEGDASVNPSLYDYSLSDGDPLYLITKANKEGTDWYDEIYQPGLLQEYALSISGGSQSGTYAFTAGYSNEEGVIINTGFERYSLRSNADTKINNWLTIGESLGLVYTDQMGNNADNGEGTVISQGYRMQPIIPVYDIMGHFAGTKAADTGNGDNPVGIQVRDKDDHNKILRGLGNVYVDFTILKDIHFKSLMGFDYNNRNYLNRTLANLEMSEARTNDRLSYENYLTFQWNWTNTLSYSKTFADVHKVNILVGTEAVESNYRTLVAGRTDFGITDPDYMYLNAGEKNQTNSGEAQDWATSSYFGRINYDFNGKYLVEATFRRDGSSRFGATNRWGNFPAASVGWRLSEENFMAFSKAWMSYLKLRLGWGLTGNDELGGNLGGNYNSYNTYNTNFANSFYSIDGSATSAVSGFQSEQYGNPDAKWESTSTTNFGIDATFLNNTLSLTVDIWQRKTSDMLYRLTRPGTFGNASYASVNIGDMDNKGFDIQIGYQNKALDGDFTYGASLNLSHYKNEIKKISSNSSEFITGGDYRQMIYTRAQVGTSYPEFYGYIVDGIFQNDAEVDAWPTAFGASGTYNVPGHFKFRDISGPNKVPDGIITDADRTYIGSPHPDLTGGLTIDLGYKNFSLSAFFYASLGNDMVNYVRRWTDYSQFTGNRSKDRLYKSWGSPYLSNNSDATLAMADKTTETEYPSTHFVEDASFLRMKSLQIGYTLPASFVKKIGLSNALIYVQSTNLFTITGYSGLDPEVRNNNNTTNRGMDMGIDAGAWPTPRQFMFGVNIDI